MTDATSHLVRSPFSPPPDLIVTFRAMASNITVRVNNPTPSARAAVARAQQVFAAVEVTCTRFNPNSSLMQANAAGREWAPVASQCYEAIKAAYAAHELTGGAFDPRILTALVAAGYDDPQKFAAGSTAMIEEPSPTTVSAPDSPAGLPEKAERNKKAGKSKKPGKRGKPSKTDRPEQSDPAEQSGPAEQFDAVSVSEARTPWLPEFDDEAIAVRVGPDPIDLGGIGKGLAVRWSAQELTDAGTSFLVEAGGDCFAGGTGPEGSGWRIAVEDPFGGTEPRAVLEITDLGCATSSIRIRRWRNDGKTVHHIIDPRTGQPGGDGLQAVTVVGPDPAEAEVWSKSLFLAGASGIGEVAAQNNLAALWVTDDDHLGVSSAMEQFVIWQRPDVETSP